MAINTYKHVDSGSSGGGDGSTWATSGANAAYTEAELETFLESTVVAGDVIFIKGGTYTLDSAYDSSARNGTSTAPIAIIGVKSTTTNTGANVVFSDFATGAGRPFFDGATYGIKLGNFYVVKNISVESSVATYPFDIGTYGVVVNCKFNNDYGSDDSGHRVVNIGAYTSIIDCEISGLHCRGIMATTGARVLFSYIHDIYDAGLYCNDVYCVAIGNVFNNCLYGIQGTNGYRSTFINNTFYECDYGSYNTGGATGGNVYINNLMEGNDIVGFYKSTQCDIEFYSHNHGNDARCTDMWSGVDTSTIFQDYNISTGDPLFASAGSDFSLSTTSPCFGAGLNIAGGVGSSGMKPNKGAWQNSLDEGARNTDPTEAKVQTGTSYKILNVAKSGALLATIYIRKPKTMGS